MRIRDLACFQHVNWKPTGIDLRKFAASMVIGFGLIGGFVAWRNGGIVAPVIRLWVTGIGLAAGAMIPRIGTFVYLAVYMATGVIGYFVSRVMLAAIFFVIVTPLAFVLRLTGKDLLRLRKQRGQTEWMAHPARRDRQSYYRQF